MENPEPGAPLGQIRLAKQRVQEQVETKLRELKELTKESVRLEQLEATATASLSASASPTAPGSPPVVASATDIPALSVDALDAIDPFDDLGDLDDFDVLDDFDAIPSVADSIAAPAAADFPVVMLGDPDSSTFAAAVLSTTPSVTPAASPPAATLTTMAFLALVALHATLATAADSPVVALDALVSQTAATDMALTGPGASANTLDALPHLPPTVATTATETILAAPATSFTTDACAAALDNSEAVSPPTKRQRTGILYDSNGNLVTRADLSKVFGHFPFLPLSRMCALYHQLFGRPLVPDVGDLRALRQKLEVMDGFRFLPVQVGGTDTDRTSNFSLLQRDGPEFVTLRQQTRTRLSLPRGFGAPIPEPLMCYSLAMLGCMPIGHLSRTALASMFQALTGSGLGSLRVVSSSGTNLMSTLDPCGMVRNWLRSLCQYIMEGSSVKRILGEAAICHKAYIGECFAKGSTKRKTRTHMDPTGEVAKKMLEDDQHNSRILLGICQSDFTILLKYLPDVMEGEDEDLLKRLRNVSDSLLNQP
ncbi:hypothetical protein H4R27_003734 [Coemansia aciculifera]|nr:hypothetical protein H4R27_003734 [Coemansia aciculifera]